MIAALLYIAGAALALVAAFLPLSLRVYAPRPVEERVAAVVAAPTQWRWHHILFASGAAVTAVAAWWEALGSKDTALYAAALGFTMGALFFASFLQARLFTPPTAWFHGTTGRRRFAAFSVLTALAIGLRGAASVQAGHAEGWLLAAYALALLGVLVRWRDLPPVAHYVATLVLGVVLALP